MHRFYHFTMFFIANLYPRRTRSCFKFSYISHTKILAHFFTFFPSPLTFPHLHTYHFSLSFLPSYFPHFHSLFFFISHIFIFSFFFSSYFSCFFYLSFPFLVLVLFLLFIFIFISPQFSVFKKISFFLVSIFNILLT